MLGLKPIKISKLTSLGDTIKLLGLLKEESAVFRREVDFPKKEGRPHNRFDCNCARKSRKNKKPTKQGYSANGTRPDFLLFRIDTWSLQVSMVRQL